MSPAYLSHQQHLSVRPTYGAFYAVGYGSQPRNSQVTQVSLTLKSGNGKTGPIPVSTSERSTCPTTCPFYDKGCYAKYGPAAIQWRKVSAAERGTSWDLFCEKIAELPNNQLWRHNQAGDLPHNEGNIAYLELRKLIDANQGRRGYTYTHHVLNEHNRICIENANARGFTVNASTECVETADAVMTEHGIPAVAVVSSENAKRFSKTKSGRKVIQCPATVYDNVNCAKCGLCAVADRDYIITFPAHGVAKKTVNQIVTD